MTVHAAVARGTARLSDGGELAYEVHGEHAGTPLLLIRPLGGAMPLWRGFRDALAQHVRVISFDHRGTGLSSADPAWVSTRSLARDALALLRALQITRVHVFGISLGGMTATWLSASAPELVARLCIASAPARGVSLSHAGIRRELNLAACFARPSRQVEAALVRRILSHRFRAEQPAEVAEIVRIVAAHPSTPSSLLKHALAGFLHDAHSVLSTIQAPVLVLAGEHDHLLGVEPQRALAQTLPHARLEIMAGVGHDLTLERPLDTAGRVLDFVLGARA